MKLDETVVLVTGASSGIGAATAQAAARAGARVGLVARRGERIRELAGGLEDAIAVPCDVTAPEQVTAAIDTMLDVYGRIDVLINNAGQGLQATVAEIDLDDFRAVLELNLIAPLRMMQAVLPTMREQGAGSIVNISSGTTLAAAPGTGAYVASKIGLERLSAVARAELADADIAVSTLIPFATDTEFITSIRAGREAAETMTAGARFHAPERVAEAILELVRTGEAQADLVPAEYGGSLTP